MLLEYIQAALRHPHHEILKDDGCDYGEIAACPVPRCLFDAGTLEDCREQLREVMEE